MCNVNYIMILLQTHLSLELRRLITKNSKLKTYIKKRVMYKRSNSTVCNTHTYICVF